MDGSAAVNGSATFILLITLFAFFLPILLYFPPVPPSKRDALLETHTQVGLGPSESGLLNKKERKSDDDEVRRSDDPKGGRQKIRSLWIYPLKSCKGIEVRQSKVLPTGLEFDRLYTFAQLKSPFPVAVQKPPSPSSSGGNREEMEETKKKEEEEEEEKGHSWHFITQRQFPLLATVQVDLFVPDPAKKKPGAQQQPDDAFLLVRFPWREPGLRGSLLDPLVAKLARGNWRACPEKEFVLPVAFPSPAEVEARGYAREVVTVWRDAIPALNMAADLPPELARYLGVSNRLGLFRLDPGRLREVYRCAPPKREAGYQPVTGFQDAYPLHLLNLASVRDFDAKIDKDEDFRELDPRRFRANIIVDGDEAPYDEENWKKIRFNPGPGSKCDASTFHVSCRTVRCKLPNVDQDTGYRHPVQPDKALRRFRDVDEGAKNMGCLGMQATPLFPGTNKPEDMESWVEVGMSIEVLERGNHVYIRQ